MAETKVGILLEAQDKVTATLTKVEGSLSSFKKSIVSNEEAIKSLQKTSGTIFVASLGVLGLAINKAMGAEVDMARSTQTLKNAFDQAQGSLDGLNAKTKEGRFDELTESMNKAGQSALKMSFDDEEASIAYSRLVQVTGSVTEANKELSIAMDLARAKGISLEQATQNLIMVHSGNTRELKQMGIQVDENATAMQNIEKIQKSVFGQSQTYLNTATGQWEKFKVTIGNTTEAVGGAFSKTFEKTLKIVTPLIEKLGKFAEEHPKITGAIGLIVISLSGLLFVLTSLSLAVIAFQAVSWPVIGMFMLVSVAIGALIAVIILMYTHWEELVGGWKFGLELMGIAWEGFWNFVYNSIITFGEIIVGGIKLLVESFVFMFEGLKTSIVLIVTKMFELIIAIFMPFIELFKAIGEGFLKVVTIVFTTMHKIITTSLTLIKEVWLFIWTSIRDFFVGIWESMKNSVKDAVDFIMKQVDKVLGLVDKIKDAGGKIVEGTKNLGGKIKDWATGGGDETKVNDAIISPDGDIITTHPDDYIIATKNPKSLGGGNGIVVNINGGMYLDENSARKIGDELIRVLDLQYKS